MKEIYVIGKFPTGHGEPIGGPIDVYPDSTFWSKDYLNVSDVEVVEKFQKALDDAKEGK